MSKSLDIHILRPDPKSDIFRYYAYIETPDGEAEGIFAYHNDAIRWIGHWLLSRGLDLVPFRSIGPVDDGGCYWVDAKTIRGLVASATS